MCAGFVVTIEAPGIQATGVSNSLVESFNELAVGNTPTISAPFGTYTSEGIAVVAPDQYGGANESRYVSVGAQSGTLSMTLDLTGPARYFGFFAAALDSSNNLDFYSGGALVVTVDIGTIRDSGLLLTGGDPSGTGHFGNPNTGENTGEPYAFINFFATGSTSFDRIVFRNDSTGTGYETDNHTVRFARVEPPFRGSEVPELTALDSPAPPTALAALALVPVLGLKRLRRVRAASAA